MTDLSTFPVGAWLELGLARPAVAEAHAAALPLMIAGAPASGPNLLL